MAPFTSWVKKPPSWDSASGRTWSRAALAIVRTHASSVERQRLQRQAAHFASDHEDLHEGIFERLSMLISC